MIARPRDVIYELPLKQFETDCPWAIYTIGQLAEVLGGGTPDTDVIEYWEPPEIPWATPTDITGTDGNEIRTTERSISNAGLKQSTLVPVNSVLMTSRATIGSAKINRVPMAINQGFAAICAKEGHSSEYLFYLLDILRPTLIRLGAGTTFLETSRREIRKIQARVPEGDEQRRIVAALKLADDAIQTARAELNATRNLKSALVAQLLAERSEKWSKTKFSGLLAEPIRNGYSPVCPQDPTGAWVLGLDALTENGFNPAGVKPAPVGDEGLLPFRLEANDIIISRSNTPELVGRVGRYIGQPEHAYYPDLMMRIRVNQDRVSPQFAELLLQSTPGRKWIKSRASGTSGSMVKIKRRDIMSMPVWLPERAEQERIVSMVSAAKNAVDASEEKLAALQDVKKSLLQNLLTGKVRIPEGAIHV